MSCDKPIRKECVGAGDSTDNVYFRATNGVTPDVSTCRQVVYPIGGGDAVIASIAVTGTETLDGFEHFEAYLTPAQTLTLTPGKYEWVIEIVGDVSVDPPFTEKVWVLLEVTRNLIPPA